MKVISKRRKRYCPARSETVEFIQKCNMDGIPVTTQLISENFSIMFHAASMRVTKLIKDGSVSAKRGPGKFNRLFVTSFKKEDPKLPFAGVAEEAQDPKAISPARAAWGRQEAQPEYRGKMAQAKKKDKEVTPKPEELGLNEKRKDHDENSNVIAMALYGKALEGDNYGHKAILRQWQSSRAALNPEYACDAIARVINSLE